MNKRTLAQISSWSLYDFANTIFSMNMLSMYFPLWVTRDMGARDFWYSAALSVSVICAGVSMPLIGAAADRGAGRVRLLRWLTLLSCVFTAALAFAALERNLAAALVLFAVANYGFMTALVPYDALLPTVSRGVGVGMVSGIGIALGYVGSVAGLFMVKPFTEEYGRAGAFLPTAVFFLLFSLPVFFLVREEKRERKQNLGAAREYKKIWVTLRNTRRYPGLLRFLIANIIYSDAVNTVIVFMAVYASAVIGMDDGQIRGFLTVSTVCAAVGSFAAGKVTDAVGPRRALMGVLALWAFTLALACVSPSRAVFWAVGPLAGISLGSTWVASRALVIKLSPPRKVGEIYGLYNLGGKFGFIVGPLIWGGIVWALEGLGPVRYRVAIFSLFVFVVVSMWVMRKVPSHPPSFPHDSSGNPF